MKWIRKKGAAVTRPGWLFLLDLGQCEEAGRPANESLGLPVVLLDLFHDRDADGLLALLDAVASGLPLAEGEDVDVGLCLVGPLREPLPDGLDDCLTVPLALFV